MLERMRQIVPDIAIRTTFIVGFPGEGRRSSASSASSSARRSSTTSGRSRIRPSPAPGPSRWATRSPAEEKERRRDFLLSLQRPIARRKNRALRGRDASKRSSKAPARRPSTSWRAACVPRPPRSTAASSINDTGGRDVRPGEIVRVRVSEAHDYDLVGGIVS